MKRLFQPLTVDAVVQNIQGTISDLAQVEAQHERSANSLQEQIETATQHRKIAINERDRAARIADKLLELLS